MNVSSSTTTQLFQNTSMTSKNSNLSSEQKDLIEEVLSKFDTDSLTSKDAAQIVEAFSEAGIEASSALTSAMEASGFDAKEVGELAQAPQASQGGGRPMGPPPPPPEEEVDSVSSLLESLLSSDEDEDEEEDSTTSTSSVNVSSSSFDAILDYTTKIMSLKDDAKTDVMSLLEQYSSEDNQLSKEDTQKFIVNSLSQILKEPDNYNTISFYA
nr:hypothetical protein [uncultured Sulfurimonas sp.]